jgi:hypothetical protein
MILLGMLSTTADSAGSPGGKHETPTLLKTAAIEPGGNGLHTAAKYSNTPSRRLPVTVMRIRSDLGRESSAQDRS